MNIIQARCVRCSAKTEWDTGLGERAVCRRCWDAGAAGHHGTLEIAERNKRIIAAREAGMDLETVAGREGVTIRTAATVIRRAARTSGGDLD